jgi:predicted RNA binding protein YcfA (HicA-like mRNA interferase family)
MKVRDLLKAVESDGRLHVKTKGSHRQYKHPTKSGRVTFLDIQGTTFIPTL